MNAIKRFSFVESKIKYVKFRFQFEIYLQVQKSLAKNIH